MALSRLKAAATLIAARRTCFDLKSFDQSTFDSIMARPAPTNTYGIFFTPRSGSTRLTDLIAEAGLSNPPREFFNETAMPRFARNHGARSLEDYIQLIQRKQQVGGHFGFEATYKHIRYAFLTVARFERLMRPDYSAFLIREDIVAQAVSVSRLIQTRVSHSSRSTAQAQTEAEEAFVYKPAQIKSALQNLRWVEARTESMIDRLRLDPVRLSYETINQLGPDKILSVLSRSLGLPAPDGLIADTHRKLKGDKAAGFAERFADSHAMEIAKIDRTRAPFLRRFHAQRDAMI